MFESFHKEMISMFDRTAQGDEAATQLARLAQKGDSVMEYAIRLKTLAASCGGNTSALRARFLGGLNPSIANELAPLYLPSELEALIKLSVRVESLMIHRQQQRLSNPLWSHLRALPPSPHSRNQCNSDTSALSPRTSNNAYSKGSAATVASRENLPSVAH
ncbi:MAG: hypothetical protein ACRC9V_07930 [Aeromonas sp.]